MMPNWSCEGVPFVEESKTLKKRELGPAEARHVGHRLRPRKRRRQHQEKHLLERIGDLALLSVVRQVLEIREEDSRLRHRPNSRVPFRHRPILQANQRIATDSDIQNDCHELFQSIALPVDGKTVDKSGCSGQVAGA